MEFFAPGVLINYMRENSDDASKLDKRSLWPLLASLYKLRDPARFLAVVQSQLPIENITMADTYACLFHDGSPSRVALDKWLPYAWLHPAPEAARILWPNAPLGACESLVRCARKRDEHRHEIIIEAVLANQWSRFVRTWLDEFGGLPRVDAAQASFRHYWERATDEQLIEALGMKGWDSVEVAPETFEVFWRRVPREVVSRLPSLPAFVMLDWINAAPDDKTGLALTALNEVIYDVSRRREPGYKSQVTKWLQDRIRRRAGPWRRCYKLLISLHRTAIERSFFSL
jgi:hypothetical protein